METTLSSRIPVYFSWVCFSYCVQRKAVTDIHTLTYLILHRCSYKCRIVQNVPIQIRHSFRVGWKCNWNQISDSNMFMHRSERKQTKLRTFNDVTIQLLSKWDLWAHQPLQTRKIKSHVDCRDEKKHRALI